MSTFAVVLSPLAVLLFSPFCDARNFDWWDKYPLHQQQLQNTVNACCPKHPGTDHPIFCCQSDLFSTNLRAAQRECEWGEGDGDTTAMTVETISCAQRKLQREIGGAARTDICRISCCNFLTNVEADQKETECSRTCERAAFTVGMTRHKQLSMLREAGCQAKAPIKFKALEKCLKEPFPTHNDNDGDEEEEEQKQHTVEMMKVLHKVCRRAE